jgi:hypothetical protein
LKVREKRDKMGVLEVPGLRARRPFGFPKPQGSV